MNRIAVIAEEHWRTHLPDSYAQISDPRAFFAALAGQAQEQIEDLGEALAGPNVPGETFMEKVSRLSQARQAAEGQVLREMVLLPSETPEPELADHEESTRDFEVAVAEFQRLREECHDREATTTDSECSRGMW